MLCVPRREAGQAVPLVLQRGNHQHQFTAIALILFKPSNVLEIQTHPYRFRKTLQKNIYILQDNHISLLIQGYCECIRSFA